MTRDHDTNIIRAACIKRQPKAKTRLREAVCFHDVLLVLALMPGRVLFDKRGTDVELVIFDEVTSAYQRATWDTLHDITEQSDDCVAFIAHVIESYRPPTIREPSPEALAALGAV